jgi:hypothetical protein
VELRARKLRKLSGNGAALNPPVLPHPRVRTYVLFRRESRGGIWSPRGESRVRGRALSAEADPPFLPGQPPHHHRDQRSGGSPFLEARAQDPAQTCRIEHELTTKVPFSWRDKFCNELYISLLYNAPPYYHCSRKCIYLPPSRRPWCGERGGRSSNLRAAERGTAAEESPVGAASVS